MPSKHVDIPFHAAVTPSLELLLHPGPFSPYFPSTEELWLVLKNSRTEQQGSSWSWVFLPYSSLFAPCLGFGVWFFCALSADEGDRLLLPFFFFPFLLRTVWWWVCIHAEILLQIHYEFLLPSLKSKLFAVWAAATICCQNSLKTKKVILRSLTCACQFACWEY